MITKRIVLIGIQGMGKTTFFNLITDSNEQTQYERMSCTRQLVQGTTRWGQGLDVIDTPGFNVSEDKLMHAAGILAGLTYGKINRILIFIKYEKDYQMYQNLEAAFNPVRRYRNLITIVVTYWDQCQINKQQQKQFRLQNTILEKYQVSNIIFKSKSDNPEFICNQIEQQINENQQNNENDGISIKLSESEIYKHFDFLDMNGQLQNQIEYYKEQVLTKFRRIAQIYEKFIKTLDKNDADFLETLHVITLSIKEQANKVIDNFVKNNRDRILQLVDQQGNNLQYLHYISLKKTLFKDMNKIMNQAQERMKESKYHVFHFIKKCQNCGEIWLKVTGCGKETICGDQANFDGLFMILPQIQVQITYDEKNNVIVKRSLEENIENIEKQYQYLLKFLMKQDEIQKCQISKQEIESILQELYGNNFKEVVIRRINNGLVEIELIGSIIQMYCFNEDKVDLYNELFEQLERKKKLEKRKKGIGCGSPIYWNEQMPLTSKELQELSTVEMLEYFTFQENIEQEEIKWLNQAYKNIIEESIKNQINNIKQSQRVNRNN